MEIDPGAGNMDIEVVQFFCLRDGIAQEGMDKQPQASLSCSQVVFLHEISDEAVEIGIKGIEASRRGLPDLDILLNTTGALFDQDFIGDSLPAIILTVFLEQGEGQ